jgi:hypothetical protein
MRLVVHISYETLYKIGGLVITRGGTKPNQNLPLPKFRDRKNIISGKKRLFNN